MSQHQFKKAWWLSNSHLQTLWPVLCRRDIQLPLERERLELPDGDFVDLDWINKDKNAPTVLILHGLEGSVESHYAKGMLKSIDEMGMRGVFMHFRGCSGEPNRLPRSYHSGDTQDAEYVAKYVLASATNKEMAAVGYSLGGNVLLKWLGETGNQSPLKVAVAVSVPFELQKAATRIQRGFSRFYQWYFIRCLCDRLQEKFAKVPSPIDVQVLEEVNTMFEFDDRITAPLHGFTGVNDYYQKSSSRQYLQHIKVPTLIVHSKDDPFMSEDIIPGQHELSPFVTLEITNGGGHVGFVEGKLPWRPEYWLEKRIPLFLKEHLK